jgi:hypothetical protein
MSGWSTKIWAVSALPALAACLGDAERCERLLQVTQAEVRELSRGCAGAADCTPLAAACGRPAAIRSDADAREVTRLLQRYEGLCGCDGGAPVLPPAACIAGQCRPGNEVLRPARCAEIEAEMLREVDRQNSCRQDDDCTTFDLRTCPPSCGRPTKRGADPGRVADLLLEYNRTTGCLDCSPSCGPATRARCLAGLCASAAPVSGDCAALAEQLDRAVALRSSCLAYADCAYVRFAARLGNRCGVPMARGEGARLARVYEAWREGCCASCALDCPTASADSARCETGLCIAAADCPRRLANAARGWTLTHRAQGADRIERTLLVRHDGIAALSPPGVQQSLDSNQLSRLVRLSDEAAILCLDSSFHRRGDAPIEVTASVPEVGSVSLAYASSDPRPSGLVELEAELAALVTRLLGGAP